MVRTVKTTVIVFAAHHTSKNIAAQRFQTLLKYLDQNRYEIHVVSRANDRAAQDAAGVGVREVPGDVIGANSSYAGMIVSLGLLLVGRSGKGVGWLHKAVMGSWSLDALTVALSIPRNRKCIVLGTYSPVDALLAAWSFSKIAGVPLMLDFRDGFSYESMGRVSRLAKIARRCVERLLVRDAALVTSVSRPLVLDFATRYPSIRVELLPNGYDPSDFEEELCAVSRPAVSDDGSGKFVVSHFGRVGASDAGRTDSLRAFVETFNRNSFLREHARVEFYGELTSDERRILGGLLAEHQLSPPIPRAQALKLMRESDFLLLITGQLTGTATGKIFEYLASKRPVLCFTGVENEATRIIEETCAGESFMLDAGFEDGRLVSFIKANEGRVRPDRKGVEAYDRTHQARMLSTWIDELTDSLN